MLGDEEISELARDSFTNWNGSWDCAVGYAASVSTVQMFDGMRHCYLCGYEHGYRAALARQSARIAELEKALEWYSDPVHIRGLLQHDRAIQGGKLKGATYYSAEDLFCNVARAALAAGHKKDGGE
jgi:hypothetical protein